MGSASTSLKKKSTTHGAIGPQQAVSLNKKVIAKSVEQNENNLIHAIGPQRAISVNTESNAKSVKQNENYLFHEIGPQQAVSVNTDYKAKSVEQNDNNLLYEVRPQQAISVDTENSAKSIEQNENNFFYEIGPQQAVSVNTEINTRSVERNKNSLFYEVGPQQAVSVNKVEIVKQEENVRKKNENAENRNETRHVQENVKCTYVSASEGHEQNGKPKEDSKAPHSETNKEDSVTERFLIRHLQENIDLMEGKNWIAENGTISRGANNILYILQESHKFSEAPDKIAKVILETNVVNKICELIIYIQTQITSGKFSESLQGSHYSLGVALGVLVNFTDISEAVAERITRFPGFLQAVHHILSHFAQKQLHEIQPVTEEEVCLTCSLNSALTVIYNVSMVESNIPHLRKLNFTDALKPYLNAKDKDDHLTALAGLAAIIDEEESEIIDSNRKVVKYLMKVLRGALKTDGRRYEGWSCKELALVIKTLARNDANKKLLVQLGGLELLVQLTKGNTEEIVEALGAIWALSFDEENRKAMVETDSLEVIAVLVDLRESQNDKITTAASGALWNLREDLCSSANKKYQALGKTIISGGHRDLVRRPARDDEGHIMISYQWTQQSTLINIRNELVKNGFKVWMDVDNMAGSTLQAMAEAVENADIVLICFSQKYKNSPNCRAEAEYSFQRQKRIIPLRMELDYKPDGWLGILVGTKLFFDFSGKYEFKAKLNKLIKEIKGLKAQNHDTHDAVISPMIPKKSEMCFHTAHIVEGRVSERAPNESPSNVVDVADRVRLWTSEDVKNWASNHSLSEEKSGNMTGDEIALLLDMKREAPEAFYKGLQKKFNYDLRLISQLVKALRDIGT